MSRPSSIPTKPDGALAERVAGAVINLQAEARALTDASDDLGERSAAADLQSRTVASMSEQTSAAMGTVAGAAEELSYSFREVSGRTSQTAQSVQQMATDTEQARTAMAALDSSSRAIKDVTDVIATVARQTNLLALNATLEATRAGDSGRGFAVVAGEVKELAAQTAAATAQIDHNVHVLLRDAERVVTAIRHIGDVVSQIGHNTAEVATMVEQQTEVTAEIARSVAQVATSSGEVDTALRTLNTTVVETDQRIQAIRRLSARLAEGSVDLNTALHDHFAGRTHTQAVTGSDTTHRLKAAVDAHGAWKARLIEAALTGTSGFDPAAVAVDDRCALGVWLHKDSSQEERRSPHYQTVRGLHARFHTLAASILEQALGGRGRSAEAAVAPGGPLDELSTELVGHLNNWRDELDGS